MQDMNISAGISDSNLKLLSISEYPPYMWITTAFPLIE